MSNKSSGTAFEREIAELLHEHGMWVHMIAQTQEGQPADLIAAKNTIAWLIDCKVCDSGYFTTARVEDNQFYSMDCWYTSGNLSPIFILKYSEGIFVLPYVQLFENGKLLKPSVKIKPTGDMWYLLTPIEEWLRMNTNGIKDW